MRIETSLDLPQPLADVRAWHERPGALVRLTSPGVATIEDPTQGGLEVGRRVRVHLRPLPVPPPLHLPWELRHASRDDVADGEVFEDRQVAGPFRLWHHLHSMREHAGGTRLEDRIDAEVPWAAQAAEGAVRSRIERMLAFRSAQLREDLDFHASHADAPRLRVAIAGASGLIGTQLTALLRTGGHTVLPMVRGRKPGPGEIAWDPARGHLDPADLEGVDAVVNLGGRPISRRFTRRALREIADSRTIPGDLLARTLARMADGPRVLVQASAIGYYGAQRAGELLTEQARPGDDALARVCVAWEDSSRPAVEAGVRAVHLRTGIVLSDGGGALPPQLPLFLAGVGGRLAPADAALSWITLDDMARAYAHALLTPELAGPVNAVAPEPASAAEFAATLGRALHRPSRVPVPALGPALLLGREGARELVRADQRVDDARLLGSGFSPAHTGLETALRHVLQCPA